MTSWISVTDTDWTAQTRTNNPATTPISSLGLPWTDNIGNCWYTEGGSVVSAVGSGGSWTVAPTITFQAANGSGTRKITATGTVALSGSALGAVTMTNCGRDYVTTPTVSLSGGSGSGGSVTATLKSTTSLQVALGSSSNGTYGSQCWLTVAAPTLDQRIVVRVMCTATTDIYPIVGRVNTSTKQLYSAVFNFNTAAPNLQVFYFNNYPTNTATTKINSVQFSGGIQAVVGHTYDLDVSFTGSNPTTITCTITDVDTGQTSTQTTTGSETGVQAANNIGMGQFTSLLAVLRSTVYQPVGVSVSPTSETLNLTSASVTLTGAGTSWTAGTPGTPTFTLTNAGGTNASIVSQVVNSTTSATLVINTGTVAGNVTISDPSTSTSTTLSLLPLLAPAAAISTDTINTSGCTITASTYPSQGTAPYTAKLYRSPNFNFAVGDPGVVLVSTQTGIGASTVPNPVTDNAMPVGPQIYAWVITDTPGQVVMGAQAGAQRFVSPTRYLGFMGDSITDGHLATETTQWANAIGVVSAGSGQVDGTYDVTVSGGLGFLGKAVVSGGALVYAYVVNHGWGFTSETSPPTPTYSAGGTPGVLTLKNSDATLYLPTGNIGGGYPLMLETILKSSYGFTDFHCLDAGVGGTAVSNSNPHGTLYVTSATNASPVVVQFNGNHGMSSGQSYPFVRIGGNTAANGTHYVSVVNSQQVALYQDAGLTQPVVGNGAYVSNTGAAVCPGGLSGYIYEAALAQFVSPSQTPWVHLLYGPNDANGGTTAAQYQQYLDVLVYNLTTAGYGVIISYPLYWSAGTQAKNLLLQQYQGSINNVVAVFSAKARLGNTSWFGLFLDYPSLLVDGLHPNGAGDGAMAGGLAPVIASQYAVPPLSEVQVLNTGAIVSVFGNGKVGLQL